MVPFFLSNCSKPTAVLVLFASFAAATLYGVSLLNFGIGFALAASLVPGCLLARPSSRASLWSTLGRGMRRVLLVHPVLLALALVFAVGSYDELAAVAAPSSSATTVYTLGTRSGLGRIAAFVRAQWLVEGWLLELLAVFLVPIHLSFGHLLSLSDH